MSRNDPAGPDVATAAGLLGDSTRLTVLTAPTGDQHLPASEPALVTGISWPTASEHLARLVEQAPMSTQRCDGHPYHRLADPDVVVALAPGRWSGSPRAARPLTALDKARTCNVGECDVRPPDRGPVNSTGRSRPTDRHCLRRPELAVETILTLFD